MYQKPPKTLSLVVSGASGLVGGALVTQLFNAGHQVTKLVRKKTTRHDELQWNPDTGIIFPAEFRVDAVVHLAGENIATGRWSKEKKWRIKESRIRGTRNLCESLLGLPHRPKTLVCASAIGFYGNRGDALVDETSGKGLGFLADVCDEWEQACQIALDAGIRVVNLRTGLVLSPHGGVLKKLLLPFSLGLGGPLGDGLHYMSWVALQELIHIIEYCLHNEDLHGAINAVSPNPVTNLDFTKTLGRVLRRPTFLRVPYGAAKMLLGEMADETLFSSTRVNPRRLLEQGFKFQFPYLEATLMHLLGQHSKNS
jgi:uncharacterized protein (TIGR01777 family)